MKRDFAVQRIALVSLAALAVGLAGCGTGSGGSNGEKTLTAPLATMTGRVHGGQQPVSGAVMQLYAVGITGLKSASTPLIAATVTTDTGGNFSITGDWNCTSNIATYGVNPQLYLVASGGNPGLPGTVNNGALVMMAALGPCSSLNASTSIFIDEVTTVASVVALAPFMADATHVGAQGVNATGLVNAFKTANVIANMSNGLSPGSALPTNATAPASEINALANMLAPCINSSGADSACSTLFAAALGGATPPANVVTAMLNICANPANHVATLFSLAQPFAPYQPALSTAPNDWTVALNFTGGGLNTPAGIAMDANGNAWIANASGNSVTELNSTGLPLTGTSGYTGSNNLFGAQGIAVDRTGNIWVADTLLSSVVQLTLSGGTVQTSTSYTSGIAGPTALAIDSGNNIWVSNFAGASVTELNSQGAMVGAGPLTTANTLQTPAGIAIDSHGNVWVADNAAWDIVEFSNNQTLLSGSGYSDGGMVAPLAIALDASLRAWIADNGSNATSLFGATGSPLLTAPFVGGGLAMPASVAVDGGGTVWVANGATVGSISELAYGQVAPVSPAKGFGSLNTPAAIAVDASGSVWTANAGDNSVTEFVGIATPVATPLAVNAGP